METLRKADRGISRSSGRRAPAGSRWALSLGLGLSCLISASTPIPAGSDPDQATAASLESQVKAAFILNFARFVEWPASCFHDPYAPLDVLVLGNRSVGDALERTVRGQTVQGRPLNVRESDSLSGIAQCQILLVGGGEAGRLAEILKITHGLCVLTVGESRGFAHDGGVINFTMEDNRVHFEVNPEAARAAGLTISSKLLSLARIVPHPPGEREP